MVEIIQAIYYLFALITAFFIVKAFRKGTQTGKKMGTALMMNFLMILTYSLNLQSDHQVVKSFGCSMMLIFTDLLLFFYYDYVLCFIDWQNRVPKWIKFVFAAYIFMDAVFMLMIPFTEIAVSFSHCPFGDGYLLTYVPQIPFHVHTVADVIMILTTMALLLMKCGEVPKVFFKALLRSHRSNAPYDRDQFYLFGGIYSD